MEKDIVGLDIQELIWSHETTEVLRIKLAEEGITAYFFQETGTTRYFGCLADDTTLKVFYRITTDIFDSFNSSFPVLRTARRILEREYQKLYFTRHASDEQLLKAMLYDRPDKAPESAKIFCYFVGLHHAATVLLGKPKPDLFFAFNEIEWHSRPRVNLCGKSRHISRTHSRQLFKRLKYATSISVKYEFFRSGRPSGKPPINDKLITDNLTMYLSMSYPDGNWDSAEVFVNHPNYKPLINLFYGYTEE